MCDIYKSLPEIDKYEWGFYKCNRETATSFYNQVIEKYPYVSHMWLHSKDMKEEWLKEEVEEFSSLSTWIYKIIKEKL